MKELNWYVVNNIIDRLTYKQQDKLLSMRNEGEETEEDVLRLILKVTSKQQIICKIAQYIDLD